MKHAAWFVVLITSLALGKARQRIFALLWKLTMRAGLRPTTPMIRRRFPRCTPRMQCCCRPVVSPYTGGKPLGSSGKIASRRAIRKNHTFEIVAIQQDEKLAYQIAEWTVLVTTATGETTKASGNTVRIFEREAGGEWLTKVHIFNLHH